MTWVLIVTALFNGQPFVEVEQFSTLQECHIAGERLLKQFDRQFKGLMESTSVGSFTCNTSTGTHNPDCGLDDKEPCRDPAA